MKKIYLIMAVACLMIVSCKKNGGDGRIQGHEYVDLGLPSGVKWATCNVGAKSPEEFGQYFAFGETEPKDIYTEENNLTSDIIFYNLFIDDIGGNTEYDAATSNWGDRWRIPSEDNFEELMNECNWIWTNINGSNGYKIVGPNANYIFIPAAGYYVDKLIGGGNRGIYISGDDILEYHHAGSFLYDCHDEHCDILDHWSSLHGTSRLDFDNGYVGWNDPTARYYGYPIRPVCY